MLELIQEYLVQYAPTLLSAVISAIMVAFLKKIGASSDKIEKVKAEVISNTSLLAKEIQTKIVNDDRIDKALAEALQKLKESDNNNKIIQKEYSQSNEEVKTLVCDLNRHYIQIEALLRKKDAGAQE